MTTNKLRAIKGIVTFVFGVVVFFIPAPVFSVFGIVLTPAGAMITRLFALACIVFGIEIYYSKNAPLTRENRPGLLATCFCDIIAAVVIVSALRVGVMNLFGWLLAITYMLSSLAFAYLFFSTFNTVGQHEKWDS